jgi:hypothetical protein
MKKNEAQSKFAASTIRGIFLLAALVFASFFASEKAFAQNVTGYLFQSFTGATTFNIDRSTTSTFQLDLNIEPTFSSIGLIYFMQTGVNGSGLFSATARNIAGSPYTDLIVSDETAFGGTHGLLDPVNDYTLGAVIANPNMPISPGNYFVARLTFSISADIPLGTYTIFLDNRGTVQDGFFNDHTLVANTVTINIVGTPAALSLVSAVSRKVHGAAGTFDINLPLTDPSGVECRNTGGDHTLVFTFTNTVVSGGATVTSGIGSVAGSPAFGGHTMTVELTGVADVQRIAVTLHGVTDNFAQVLPDTTVSMNMLIADSNANHAVNSGDVNRIKAQVGLPVTAANFLTDINVSGTVTASDVAQVKANSGHTLP